MRDEEAAPEAVCVGESMAVLLREGPGPLDTVDTYRAAVGGAESNTACGLAALGIRTAWVSRVGADGFGRRLTAEIAGRGVDVSAVTTDPQRPTGVYLKEIGGSAHPGDLGPGRARLHYYRAGGRSPGRGLVRGESPGNARRTGRRPADEPDRHPCAAAAGRAR